MWKIEDAVYAEIEVPEGQKIENEEEITFKKIFPGTFSELMKDLNAQISEPQRH